ncbi:MAG: ABC transporter substrate-binding protein [Kofleriaceae bacterium]
MNLKTWTSSSVRGGLAALCAFALVLGAGAGAGCGKGGGDKIVVGHFASMTGSEATFGVSTDNGVKLAVEERNAAGGVKGKQIVVKTMDDASKASEAGNVVQRLISEEKVVALIGEVASSSSLAGGKVAQEFGVPMVSPSSTNAKVTEGRSMVSRVCFLDDFQGYVAAKFAKDHLKANNVAVLFDQGQAYSKGLADVFTKEFTALGGKVVTSQAYTGGDADVSAQLQTIKTSGAEAVFLPGYYTDAGNIVKQARKLGIDHNVPFLGGDGWDSVKLAEIGQDAIEGSYYSNHYSFDETRPEVQEFVTKYKKRFGEVPDGLAALGYDAARVLFAAMDKAPSLGGKDLAATIAATKDFPGVTGKITLDANRDAQKQAVVVQMKGGKPRWVATIVPKGWPEPAVPGAPAGEPAAAGSADDGDAGSAAAAPSSGSADHGGSAAAAAAK